MASGDAVAPTAFDRPQCFIEKERVSFLCRELVCCRVVCFPGDDVYATTTRGNLLHYICIVIYTYNAKVLLTLIVRGVVCIGLFCL